MDINAVILTSLSYKDIALIAVALGDYQRLYGKTANPEVLKRAKRLVDRLGTEMYNTEENQVNILT